MGNKGFNKALPHYCEYCINGRVSEFSDEVLCSKKGITHRKDCCRHYKYDPLSRMPKKAELNKNYSAEDFSI